MSYPYGVRLAEGGVRNFAPVVNLAPIFPINGNGLGGLPQRIYHPPMPIGTPYEGGFFAGQISTSGNGVADYNLVVGPRSVAQTGGQWKTSRTATPGADSVIDGPGNTLAIVLDGDATVYPVAHFCYNLTAGGYEDWYLPAPFEQNVIYFYMKPTVQLNALNIARDPQNPYSVPPRGFPSQTVPTQTQVLDFRAGGIEAYDTGQAYWSSRQVPTAVQYANINTFNIGYILQVNFKNNSALARAVRRVPV